MSRRSVALLALISGCSFGSDPAPAVIDNSCADDSDCEQGRCSEEVCIDGSNASVDVAIEVLRSPSDVAGLTPASWMFGSASASGAAERNLDLPPTRQVVGTVRWNGAPIPATLRFVRRMDDSVEPVAVEAETLRATSGDTEAFDFSVILVAGETYDVVILPTADMVMAAFEQESIPAIRTLPPLYLEVVIDDTDPSQPFRFDVEFPSTIGEPCTVDRSTGCTFDAEVVSIDGGEPSPERGLQVRAIDMTNGRVVSSIGETDEFGRVSIRIDDTAADYWIRVTSSVGRAPFPSVSVDPKLVFANDPVKKVIYIPRLSSLQVSGRVRDVTGSSVPGATVRFLSTGIFDSSQLGLQGSFSASATTNEDGTFGAELLAGFYSIAVTPPADAENSWGVLHTEAVFGGELTTTEDLVVPSQIGLSGWISTFRDEPAPGLTIVARARAISEAVAMHRSQEVISSSSGSFAMSIDEGAYDVQVKVPSETGFAWLVEPGVSASADTGDLERTYELPPPIPVRGLVRASDGSAVEGALIRGYVSIEGADQTVRRIQIAETSSAADGSYQLLIAPRFGGSAASLR